MNYSPNLLPKEARKLSQHLNSYRLFYLTNIQVSTTQLMYSYYRGHTVLRYAIKFAIIVGMASILFNFLIYQSQINQGQYYPVGFSVPLFKKPHRPVSQVNHSFSSSRKIQQWQDYLAGQQLLMPCQQSKKRFHFHSNRTSSVFFSLLLLCVSVTLHVFHYSVFNVLMILALTRLSPELQYPAVPTAAASAPGCAHGPT